MAIALRDAGFQDVEVNLDCIVLDEVYYQVDDDLTKWQQDAIDGAMMFPIAMKLDRGQGSIEFLEDL